MDEAEKNKAGNSEPEDKTIFRKPVERTAVSEEKAPEPKTPKTGGGGEDTETDVPIAVYQDIMGVPYTAKFFGIEKIWDHPDVSYKEDVEAIERAYKAKVGAGEIEDSEKAFRDFVRQAEKATNCQNAPVSVKLAKIAEFVKFMARLDEIDRQRKRWQS